MDLGRGSPEGSNLRLEVSLRVRTEPTVSVGPPKLRERVDGRPVGGARFLGRLAKANELDAGCGSGDQRPHGGPLPASRV